MADYTDLYGDVAYPDPGQVDATLLDPRTAAMRRRAKTLRKPQQSQVPLEAALTEVPGEDMAPADETATPKYDAQAPGGEQDASQVLGAGAPNPELNLKSARAKALLGTEMPQGRMVGKVFVASSPLEMAAAMGGRMLGAKLQRDAMMGMDPAAHRKAAEAALRLPADQRGNALLLSQDPGFQKAGVALLAQRRADAALAARAEADRLRALQQIDLEAAKQGGRESLAKLRASLKGPATPPHPSYTVAIGPDGRAYRVERTTGAISRAELPPAGPPPGAAPGSREAKDAEALALDKLPSDVRAKYNVYDWQTKNLPSIISRVENAPADTFGPGSDMASFVPSESISAVVRTWQDKNRTPAQIEARRAVFSDAYTKIKELAGTAMTQTESNRLREFLPNGNDTPAAIVAKLRGAYEESRRQRQNVRGQYLSGFPEAPVGAAGSAPAPAPTGAVMRGTSKSGRPILSNDGGKTWVRSEEHTL